MTRPRALVCQFARVWKSSDSGLIKANFAVDADVLLSMDKGSKGRSGELQCGQDDICIAERNSVC